MKPRKRVVGRRRWARLTQFLENVMETSKSERTRMTAALRLCDVLLAREQREQAELRAAERSASKEPDVQPAAPAAETEPEESATDAARKFLKSIEGSHGNE